MFQASAGALKNSTDPRLHEHQHMWAIQRQYFFFSFHHSPEGAELAFHRMCMHPCSALFKSATSWIVACEAPLSVKFSRKEYWSGPSSRGSSQARNQTHVSCIPCIGRQVFLFVCFLLQIHLGIPAQRMLTYKM